MLVSITNSSLNTSPQFGARLMSFIWARSPRIYRQTHVDLGEQKTSIAPQVNKDLSISLFLRGQRAAMQRSATPNRDDRRQSGEGSRHSRPDTSS
jgi:hypothetical protein